MGLRLAVSLPMAHPRYGSAFLFAIECPIDHHCTSSAPEAHSADLRIPDADDSARRIINDLLGQLCHRVDQVAHVLEAAA